MIFKRFLFVLLASVITTVYCVALPDRPVPPRLVNDFTGTLAAGDAEFLEQKLRALNDSTSVEVAVVFVSDLEGYDVADYATRLGHQWGVGKKDTDNGIVVLVNPKTASGGGKVNISTGYGIESIVPDAIANRIIDLEMIPRFKQNDYAGGVNAAVDVLAGLVSGKFNAEAYAKGEDINILRILPLAIVLILVLVVGSRKRKNARIYSGGKDIPLWMLMAMMGGSSRSGSGSFGGFSSGGGSFGGFGGGGFGGGGASGSW